jgi:hypothetical protein
MILETKEIDLEVAVAQFLNWADSCAKRNRTAREVMQEMLVEYKNTRIAHTNLEKENDMLLFQWSNHTEYLFPKPIDLRNYASRGGDAWLSTIPLISAPHLNFTRQVVAGENDDLEFDDVAIQMSITLLFEDEASIEKNESGNLWVSATGDNNNGIFSIENGLEIYLSTHMVTRLLDKRPSRFTSNVGDCG